MPSDEEPEKFLAETDGDTVTGALLGVAGTECPYYITAGTGRRPRCCPFPSALTATFWPFYWWGRRPGARWAQGLIVPATGLDPVEGALAVAGPAWNGLPVAARALAAWERIADQHGGCFRRIRHARWPRPWNRLVAFRAGGRTTFAEAAGRFRVPEQDVRRADRAVRPLLTLGPGQPW